ncbi:MAG TPA: polyphosphate kinase 1 [Myxococcota bacterium]|nr:polyphosphate kinase 1 [Myxococcota bacterium]HRY94969.1 polyphosphate kinase 1 [Myxococcota bacterium]HSA19968.1 polyphosphate kinase 1 [Myxococcota bacterium]
MAAKEHDAQRPGRKRKVRKVKLGPLKGLESDPSHGLTAREYLNRELSWLEFNRRVLHEAADERTPLLERARFLAIFTSNLDEFVMKRLNLLKRQVQAGVLRRGPHGMDPQEQLQAIRKAILPMLAEQARVYQEQLVPELARQQVHLLGWDQLSKEERGEAAAIFRQRVFPVLTPLSVDPGHPFPFLSNLSTSLGVSLRHPGHKEKLFARIKIPPNLPPFVRLDAAGTGHRFLSILALVQQFVQDLFPGMEIRNQMPFRITRNADVERDEADADDLLELIEQELRQRRFERAVRLEHGPDPVGWMQRFLMEELELAEEDVYVMPALLDYGALKLIADLPLPELRYPRWSPLPPKALSDERVDIFAAIRRRDLVVHHPYESFEHSVERFVTAAAEDPQVEAIKITLYRTGDDSPFIPALVRAAEAGKQVVAIVELKARFDEQRNIHLAQMLEEAGVHVVYGIVGLKTHTKTTLVVRNEPEGLRCYAHIGTGNYHVATARLYTDVSLLTCRPELTGDLVDLFHFLTGRSLKREYRKLLVAPVTMRERLLGLIRREAENRKAGKPARIVAKMNQLEDRKIIAALYQASRAGVPIELVVRGFCCLRPGVKDLSETIRVSSVIGRFLEHARVFHFAAGQDKPAEGEFYLGSADWMYRNLQNRVELVTPVEDTQARARLWELLEVMLQDHRSAWDMRPDGSYQQRKPAEGGGPGAIGTHAALMERARRALLPE